MARVGSLLPKCDPRVLRYASDWLVGKTASSCRAQIWVSRLPSQVGQERPPLQVLAMEPLVEGRSSLEVPPP